MTPHRLLPIALILLCATLSADAQDKPDREKQRTTFLMAEEAGPDFAVQGEYVGSVGRDGNSIQIGIQVIALGDGKFRAVTHRGGLPGAGWNGEDRRTFDGSTEGDVTSFVGEQGSGTIKDGVLTIANANGKELGKLERTIRKSDTLNQEPPAGAVVLFDGSSADEFKGGRMTDDGLLMQGVTSHKEFNDFKLHLEFQLSFMPFARGQQRSNSGVYMQGRYECQVLDSFGLDGKNNECGGIYTIASPSVNMCLPPLSWQTYDVEFTAARFDDSGKLTKHARMSVWHNGVQIHDDVELPKSTTAAPKKIGPEPGPIYIQDHRNEVRFRNIWVVPR